MTEDRLVKWFVVWTDYSVRPGASQGLVLSKFIQPVRPARRRRRAHFIRARVSRLHFS